MKALANFIIIYYNEIGIFCLIRLLTIKQKGVETKCTLLDLEYFIINENFHILNVDENHYANYQHKIKHTSNEKITHQTEEIKNMLKEKKAKWSKKSIQNLKTNKQ